MHAAGQPSCWHIAQSGFRGGLTFDVALSHLFSSVLGRGLIERGVGHLQGCRTGFASTGKGLPRDLAP